MNITIFTSNKVRHLYLIKKLSKICEKLFVVLETDTIFTGLNEGDYNISKIKKEYFSRVIEAEKKIFSDETNYLDESNLSILPIKLKDINNLTIDYLNPFLKSDLYIVYGSSYIKNDLLNILKLKKTLNIHGGLSPWFKGTDCNFWALYLNKPQFVGSTIHYLTEEIDGGDILYHALSNIETDDPFIYSMSTIKSAFISIIKRISSKKIFSLSSVKQDKKKIIKQSFKKDFTDKTIEDFYKMKIDLRNLKFDQSLYKDSYIWDGKDI